MELSNKPAATVMTALEALDPNWAALVRRRWEAHASQKRPLLVLFGPQNSGKSNLLKRLLIDADLPVPPWLRTSARPEDTTGQTVDWEGWRILDLPGLGSEQQLHDDTAWDALELADAVLLVMSHKLLTGEGLEALAIVDGSWWSADSTPLPWPADGLSLVVARADDSNADPEEDPEELDDLKAELEPAIDTLLAPVGGRGSAKLYWTVASPSGLLDRKPDLKRRDLDQFRSWDGMAELADALRAASASSGSLRAAALTRFLNRTAKEAKAATTRQLDELRTEHQRARVRVGHRDAVNKAVDGTLESVKAKLTAVVVECFASVLDDAALSASPGTALRDAYATRADTFEATFQNDVADLTDELRRLIETLPELKVEERQPAASGTGGSRKPEAAGPDLDVEKAASSLRELGRQGVEVHLGAPISEVKGKLQGLAGLEGDELAAALKKAGFDSAKDADAAKRLIGRFEKASRVLDAGPQAVKLFELLRDYRRGKLEQSRVKQAAAQQDRLVAEHVTELMSERPDGYATRLERLRTMALTAFGNAAEDEERSGAEIKNLEERLAALEQAVANLRD